VRGQGLGGDTGPRLSSSRQSAGVPFLSFFFIWWKRVGDTGNGGFLCALLLPGARPARPPLPSPPGGSHVGPSCPPCKPLPLSPTLVSTSSPRVCHTSLSPSGSGRSALSPVRAGGFVGRLCRPLCLPRPFCDSLLMIVKFLLFLQEGKR